MICVYTHENIAGGVIRHFFKKKIKKKKEEATKNNQSRFFDIYSVKTNHVALKFAN